VLAHDALLGLVLVAIAPKLSGDRTGQSAQHFGNGTRTASLHLHRHYDTTFFGPQLLIRSVHATPIDW
jgi:hypothetical protein